jgi:D-threonate/D-erythronate kinase
MAIVIIADDLSGAAELAGIAFSQGYQAEVQRQFDPASEAEVIAVDTDSRSLPAETAAERVRQATTAIAAAKPTWIFKKVDSLLRGNVRSEIEVLLEMNEWKRAVLIPANPSRSRTIENGQLLIDGVPMDRTALAQDPDHPRRSADVAELLGDGRLNANTITIPDVANLSRLHSLATQIDDQVLAAGAADFFTALLERRGRPTSRTGVSPKNLAIRLPALLVCGSRATWDRRAAECAAAGVPSRTLQPVLFDLADDAANQLGIARRLLLGIGDAGAALPPAELVARLASLTALVLERSPVATLLVEGGATAAAVVHRLGWSCFAVVSSSPAGIGVLRPLRVSAAPTLWIKPGSYPWPQSVWRDPQ